MGKTSYARFSPLAKGRNIGMREKVFPGGPPAGSGTRLFNIVAGGRGGYFFFFRATLSPTTEAVHRAQVKTKYDVGMSVPAPENHTKAQTTTNAIFALAHPSVA